MTQIELDAALDRQHVFPVIVSDAAPLPVDSTAYDPIRVIEQTGFTFTARELIHAIGSKTAVLPRSETDACLNAGFLYTIVLDLFSDHLRFIEMDSDLQTPRSQEVGIGMTCLVANKLYGVPWDQLGSLPGPGSRFDYRGQVNGFECIFESKGTSHRGVQRKQIGDGIRKKDAHHNRGDKFDVELIISTFIGHNDDRPRIVVGDPDFDKLAELYDRSDNRFFRLRHYSRILQFVGLPKSAFHLNCYAHKYLKGEQTLRNTIELEKEVTGRLTTKTFGSDTYYGRWINTVVPEESNRYMKERFDKLVMTSFRGAKNCKVFQGIREDVYHAGLTHKPFAHDLLSREEIDLALEKIEIPASLFPDGTLQLFEED